MQTYAEFCPTSFDSHITLDNQEDWIVATIGRNRDNQDDPVTASNWEAQLAIFDDADVEYEIHSFGHWGCGWFEIVLVNPSFAHIVEDIEARLEDYPLLDDDAHSVKEWEARCEDWDNYGRSDFERKLRRLAECWFDHRDCPEDDAFYSKQTHCQHTELHTELCQCGKCLTTELDAQNILCNWLDNVSTEIIDRIAELCEREVYHDGGGTVFRHNPTLQLLIDNCTEL